MTMAAFPEGAGHSARSLLEGAVDPRLTPAGCDIEHWLHAAPQGHLLGLTRGHSPGLAVPPHMLEPGPLRQASLVEFAFRATTEEATARNLSHLVLTAPTRETMDFFATQLIDEARHADVFRWHLIERGILRERLDVALAEIVGAKRQTIIRPLQDFALDLLRHPDRGFIGGVVFLTIIGEGALAPAAEMSERKWRVLDPPASEIAHGANLDEIRHLGVGTAIVRQYVRQHPDERDELLDLIGRGMKLWEQLPLFELFVEREQLFQEGMAKHRHLLDDYELVLGRPLADTTVEERIMLQLSWSAEMKRERLAQMGLGEEGSPR
jgi:hypothetical protein